MPRRAIAVVPFGARSADARTGAWGRQLARRLVDRFADHPSLDLKPVFLVAMPEASSDAGYLVFGSTPDAALAAQYGASLGATHALTGVLRDGALEAALVEVAAKRAIARLDHPIPAGGLPETENVLAAWLATSLGTDAPASPPLPAAPAYAALLEGLDEEVNATLLAANDPGGSREARVSAGRRYLEALRADAGATAAEERLLVLAAESIERGEEPAFIGLLEQLIEIAPRSWRGHYLLAELRRLGGDANGAIVAFEHADSLQPLRDVDSVRLAELHLAMGAEATARARLRRLKRDSTAYARAQVLLGALALQQGDLPNAVERYRAAIDTGAPADARLGLARALIASGDRDAAAAELDALLEAEQRGEAAANARRLLLGLRHAELEQRLERAGQAAVGGAEADLGATAVELDAVIAAQPDLWEAHFAAGLVARRRGDAAVAERSFRRVLELWPEQPDALHELGVALLMAERTGEAVPLLDSAARLRPEDAGYLADAGFAHLRAGDLGAARERLTLANELAADDPITHAYLRELARVETAGRPN